MGLALEYIQYRKAEDMKRWTRIAGLGALGFQCTLCSKAATYLDRKRRRYFCDAHHRAVTVGETDASGDLHVTVFEEDWR